MRCHLILALVCVLCSSPLYCQAKNHDASSPLHLEQTISLPDAIKGNFDHFGVDLKHRRLFATPEDYKAVLVLDLNTGKPIHQIHGIARPHAVLYRADLDRIYVTDGGDGIVRIYDGDTYAPVGMVSLLKDADSIGYDASKKYLYIVNGGGDVGQTYSMLTVVDTSTDKIVGEVRIDGDTLEAMALDTFRPRLYINDKATNHVVVVDRWKDTIVANWPVTMGTTNVAMALDEQRQRLFVGCRSGQIVIFDTNTGKELQKLPITKGVDDLIYDVTNKRIYAAGNGAVDVFQQQDADHYNALGSVPTGVQGKTARLVPELNRLFVAVPRSSSGGGRILVFAPSGVPAYMAPSTEATVSVHAPLAEKIILNTLSAHPFLRKMGLHAVLPGGGDSVIIANGDATRVGRKTTVGDFEAIRGGKTFCVRREDGSFYNLKLPISDAAGHPLVMLVMEIPYTAARDEADAIQQAEIIRNDVSRQIPSLTALFQQ